MGAINVVMDQTPSAVVRLLSGKMEISNAWLPGIIGPDTAPWRMRKAISELRLHAIPHRNEANVKRRTDATNVRTTPKRPINQPVRGTATPLATAKEVTIQVPLSALTPRRSEEHTSELQSLMRISYAVFCLKKKKDSTRAQIKITKPRYTT